jgi:hypothetical protein
MNLNAPTWGTTHTWGVTNVNLEMFQQASGCPGGPASALMERQGESNSSVSPSDSGETTPPTSPDSGFSSPEGLSPGSTAASSPGEGQLATLVGLPLPALQLTNRWRGRRCLAVTPYPAPYQEGIPHFITEARNPVKPLFIMSNFLNMIPEWPLPILGCHHAIGDPHWTCLGYFAVKADPAFADFLKVGKSWDMIAACTRRDAPGIALKNPFDIEHWEKLTRAAFVGADLALGRIAQGMYASICIVAKLRLNDSKLFAKQHRRNSWITAEKVDSILQAISEKKPQQDIFKLYAGEDYGHLQFLVCVTHARNVFREECIQTFGFEPQPSKEMEDYLKTAPRTDDRYTVMLDAEAKESLRFCLGKPFSCWAFVDANGRGVNRLHL